MPTDAKRSRHILVEDAVILLSILVLWPTVLGWTGLAFRALQGIALVCLAAILAVRIRRVKGRSDD